MPKVGSINSLKSDESKSVLKLNLQEGQTLVMGKDDALFIDTPEQYYRGLEQKGFIDATKAADLIAKTPSFVKRIISAKKENIRGTAS